MRKEELDIPDDVMEIARVLAGMPEDRREHINRIVQVAARIEDDAPILSKLLGVRPDGKRYKEYEKQLRRAQKQARQRGGEGQT